jgi:phosphoglycerate dehydrogenase-like enzyme
VKADDPSAACGAGCNEADVLPCGERLIGTTYGIEPMDAAAEDVDPKQALCSRVPGRSLGQFSLGIEDHLRRQVCVVGHDYPLPGSSTPAWHFMIVKTFCQPTLCCMANTSGAKQRLSIALAYPLEPPDLNRLNRRLRELHPQGEVLSIGDSESPPAHCQAYFACDDVPAGLAEHRALEWIQACSAGADAFHSLPNVARGSVAITSASGMHSVHIAEFVLAAMINLSRRMDRLWSFSASHTWPAGRGKLAGPALRGKTVAVLGYGSIGREVGRMCHALGMQLVAICATPGRHADEGYREADGIGDPQGWLPIGWYSTTDLATAVAAADFLVVTCPLTAATVGVVNAGVLSAMKPGSFIVNVARGGIIDFESLADALRSGHLGGAALDVHPREPLQPDDPVYNLPNAQITPHMSGVMSDADYSRLLCDVYLENLGRFVRGEPLLNRVDPRRGY